MNYAIKINLLKLPGAIVRDIRTDGTTKRCLIIPLCDSCLYIGNKGIYLNGNISERKTPTPYGGWTHSIKPNIPADEYRRMSMDERAALPYLGSMKPLEPATVLQEAAELPPLDIDTIIESDYKF